MALKRSYGILAGAVVGALPFWILPFRTGERWPAGVALVTAVVLSYSAWRTPWNWTIGVAAGIVASWAALRALIGADWRLIPYVLGAFLAHYLCAAGVVIGAYLLRSNTRPAT